MSCSNDYVWVLDNFLFNKLGIIQVFAFLSKVLKVF